MNANTNIDNAIKNFGKNLEIIIANNFDSKSDFCLKIGQYSNQFLDNKALNKILKGASNVRYDTLNHIILALRYQNINVSLENMLFDDIK